MQIIIITKTKSRNVSDFTLVETDEELIEDRFDTIESVKTEYDSALYGKIFHKILEKSIKPAQLKDFLDDQIKNDNIASEISNKFYEKISLDLKNYTTSKTAELINSYPNNRNEFEIYVKEKDYFLHGVIDKIIFDKDRIAIYDYKTDQIQAKEIKNHAEYYLMQLKFYLYIASKLFSDFDIFEGTLVFVKHPDELVTINYTKKQIKNLEMEIADIINSIRNNNFQKKLNHCKVCTFSGFTNKCIIN